MDAIAKSRAEAGPCRNKPKTATALTDEQKAQFEKDRQFLELIEAGQMDDVRAMLDAGQAINVGKESGESTMHLAIYGCCRRQSSDKEIIELLVKRGAFVDYADNTGKRPINVCCEMQEWGVPFAKVLLALQDKDGNKVVDLSTLNSYTQNNLLHDCAWVGNTACMDLLLKTKAFDERLEERNKEGKTVLHVASIRSPKTVVELLINAGCDMKATEANKRRLSKETPDMMAASVGRDDTAEYAQEHNNDHRCSLLPSHAFSLSLSLSLHTRRYLKSIMKKNVNAVRAAIAMSKAGGGLPVKAAE